MCSFSNVMFSKLTIFFKEKSIFSKTYQSIFMKCACCINAMFMINKTIESFHDILFNSLRDLEFCGEKMSYSPLSIYMHNT